jgi:O-antigen/teichoic acid export membrane protein
MAGIVRNTLVNLTAQGVNAAVSLLLAPVLVLAYGIDKYGLIILARNVLPGGFVSLFDLGLPEAVIRYTSSGVAAGQRDKAQNVVVSAMTIAAAVALALALVLAAAAELLIEHVFRVPADSAAGFRIALWTSAALLVLQFPGFILKSALEGLERFDVVRSAEIAGTIAYAAGAAGMALSGIAYHWVIVLFAATSTARLAYFALFLLGRKPAGLELARGRWSRADIAPVFSHAYSFFQGKVLSVAFNYAPSLVMSAVAGPAAAGVYDLLMRIPRMVKVLSGMFGSALLPFASRSEVRAQTAQMERVLYSGTMLALLLVVPVASAVAVFAGDVLAVWLGAQFGHLAPWLALAMAWPAVIGLNAIGNSMIIASPVAVQRLNLISLAQVSVFYAVSLLWPADDPALGFVVGTVTCVLVAAPLQIGLLVGYYRLSLGRYLAPLGKVLATGLVLFALVHVLGLDAPRAGITWLGARLAAWCLAYWTVLYFCVLSGGERQEIDHVVRRLASVLGVQGAVGR